ncbi:hypothetical protein [Photobacterium damselae]|uniref:hypothetical protein n=1 Tax=Photobacterium damselae TaxID=38293 RepID=UPI0010FD473D|nr:hypothetical protein [Photobacterium damselae]TLS77477.1 hypothetical protein FD721_11640 [Photobacterium damselae subsp. damselae]TLS89800.1 hypothetical protein FD720_01445 [Photobacterium damselae subsp. damselae]
MIFSLSGFYVFYLLMYFSILSLNVVFSIELDKITYIPLLVIMFLFIIYDLRNINIRKNELMVIFCFLSLLVLCTLIRVNIDSIMYSLSIFFQFIFLFVILKNKTKISRVNLILAIRIILFVTLLFGLVSLTLPSSGWSWPVNISIQELVILILFCSLLLISDVLEKKNIILFLMAFLLLSIRQSGKATLFCLILLIIMSVVKPKNKVINLFLNNFIILYFMISLIVLVVVRYKYGDFLHNYHYYIINDITNIDVRGDFWKRMSLIFDAMYHQTFLSNFIFGSGLGVRNYLNNSFVFLKNTPQLLILTLQVYGGILFTFTICFMFYFLRKYMIFNAQNDKYNINMFFCVLLLFLTTHEYINNPFLYSSLGIYILALKNRSVGL